MKRLPRGTWRLLGVIGIFIILIVVVVSWAYTCVKTYQILYFTQLQLIVCQLPINKIILKLFKMSYCK